MQTKKITCFLLLATHMLSGCSTTPERELPANAWQAYQSFKKELESNLQTTDLSRHLASNWIEFFRNAEGHELEDLKNYAAYPAWLSTTHAHYQMPSEDGYCLLVNGIASDQTPGTVSIRYIIEGDRLKASEIHYQYWGNGGEFPDEAKCPEDFELDFPD